MLTFTRHDLLLIAAALQDSIETSERVLAADPTDRVPRLAGRRALRTRVMRHIKATDPASFAILKTFVQS